jgi:lysozyme
MDMSNNGLDLTKISEGLRTEAYPDPGTGGDPWTIGYGHTNGVYPGETCTDGQATAWLREDIGWAENVIRNCPFAGQLKQQEFDALVDFVFNVGTGQPGHKDGFVWLRDGNHSTIYRKLVGGDDAGAANEFPKWDLPPLPGIVTRRRRERQLFLTGTWT